MIKNPPLNTGDIRDIGSVPALGRSPGRGHGNPLQYSYLENPTDRRAWRYIVHWVTKKSDTTEVTYHPYIHIFVYMFIYNSYMLNFGDVESFHVVFDGFTIQKYTTYDLE